MQKYLDNDHESTYIVDVTSNPLVTTMPTLIAHSTHSLDLRTLVPRSWKSYAANRYRNDCDVDLNWALAEVLADMLIGFAFKGQRIVQASNEHVCVGHDLTVHDQATRDELIEAVKGHVKVLEMQFDGKNLDREVRRWHRINPRPKDDQRSC